MSFATELLILHSDALLFDEPSGARQLFRDKRKLSEADFNKLMAAAQLVKTNFYWTRFYHWASLTMAIGSGVIPMVGYPTPDIDDIGWSIIEAVLLTPDINECREFFDQNIHAYVLEQARLYGAFPFTWKRYIPEQQWSYYDNTEETAKLNNEIIIKLRLFIDAIKRAFSERGEEINELSLRDIEERLSLFYSDYTLQPQ